MNSLPSLAPTDSYSLWYTSSTSPRPSHLPDPSSNSHDASTSHQSRRAHPPHRTPLARLRLDEAYMEQRKLNIQNYGNGWLKPPGIPKTLFQQTEERREMEEHAESLRREQLQQELADAEAQAELLQGEGMDGEDEGGRDLDDDIPDADVTLGSLDDDNRDGDEENENGGREVNPGDGGGGGGGPPMPVRAMITEMRARAVAAANQGAAPPVRFPTRVPDDVYREALARGEDPAPGGFGDDGETVDEEPGEMLQEEDLVHGGEGGEGYDMDMDADLDAEIPDADEPSGYEHTDTEAELSSSEDDDESVDAGRLPNRLGAAASSMIRSDGTQNSMDLSGLISGNDSSQIGSSPQLADVRRYRRNQ